MSLSGRLDELKKKHETLSALVEETERAPGSDHLEVAAMKRQKLKIKEEISRLTG